MKCHQKLLVFLGSWLMAIGTGFWLSGIAAHAGVCETCIFCEAFEYVNIDSGEVGNFYGYEDEANNPAPQAYNGGGVNDSSEWLYVDTTCNSSGQAQEGSPILTIINYGQLIYACDLPDGASPPYFWKASSGITPNPMGTVAQFTCSGAS